MSNPSYDLEKVVCANTSEATLTTLQSKIEVDGQLRNGKVVKSGSQSFVSAELHLDGKDRHEKGDILTWVTDDLEGSEFFSVDINAREDSSWPDADVTVTAPGARESRACVAPSTGKTPAQVQCELDQSSGQIPTDMDCEDL